MPLFTKSIQEKKKKNDGIRVCIMRRPGSEDDWDIWMPTLAPSHQLLTAYHQEEVDWEEFCVRFNEEVLRNQRRHLDLLIWMAKKETITILCWEDTPEFCHRRLVAEKCRSIDPELEVTIK